MCNCNLNFGKINDKFDISYEPTDNGVKFNVEPKDKSKVEAFKKFVEACNDFNDCC